MSSEQMAPFVGFEKPPTPGDITQCASWRERLLTMVEHHEGKWTKFGPYFSKKTAQNTVYHINSYMRELALDEWDLDRSYVEEGEGWYLFLRARKR